MRAGCASTSLTAEVRNARYAQNTETGIIGPLSMLRSQHYLRTVLIALSCFLSSCAAHDEYIAAALEHTDRAVMNGQHKDNNALAEQATVALRYAYLAERNKNQDSRLQKAILLLKDAVRHARFGRSEAGRQAAEEAYGLLAEMQ